MLKKHDIENLITAVYEKQNVYLFGLAENLVMDYLYEVRQVKTVEVEHQEFYVPNLNYSSQINLVRLSEAK